MATTFPGLNSNGFYFLKDKVYAIKTVTVQQLKNFIDETFQENRYNRDLYLTVCESVRDRLEECTNVERVHFDHLRD